MIDAWNALGLDYAVFGNHEFDLKTPELLQRMKESKFPWLGANVVYAKTGKRFGDTPPYIIRKIEGVKIGIIGLLLPETKETSSMDATLEVKDFCAVAKLLVPQIRKAGARVVIGLTHMFLVVKRPETKRIHCRDRPCAHREHVPQDAPDACCCALKRLDEGRMIM